MLLSFPELLVVLGLTILMGLECCLAIRSKSWVQIYRPTLFVAIVLSFYALVGPLRAILATGEAANFVNTSGTIYRGLDHRPFLYWGWLGALLFYAFLLIGFYISRPLVTAKRLLFQPSPHKIQAWGQYLCVVGLTMYALVNGGKAIYLLNPFAPEFFRQSFFGLPSIDFGPFNNYFKLAINLLIPGTVIQFAAWLRTRKRLYLVLVWLLIATLIFLSETFRYRILLLYVPILLLWFFYLKRRPRLVFLLVFMFFFVSVNGVIGISRSYIRGLDLSRMSGYSPVQIFNSSFEEAGVFFTTSAVIDLVPRSQYFVGLQPVISALAQPIPRSLFPSKPQGNYATNLRTEIYKTPYSYTAYLNYAEYYIVAGWTSLIGFSFALGLLLRRVWSWFLIHQYEPLAQAAYILTASFIYVIVSRGYLAQVVMLYAFTVLPAFVIYWITAYNHKNA